MNDVQVDSRIESIIWKRIGSKSTRQIAEELSLPVDEVARIKRTLLESVDEISLQQKRQRLMMELDSLAQKAQEDAESASFEFKAGLLNSSVAAMKTMLAELARMEKADTSKVDTLNQLRVRELVQLLQEVVDVSVIEAAKRFDVPEEEMFDIFNRNLQSAAQRRDAIA